MGSISHHIMPLVINSLGGRHTHMHTYRCAHRNNFKKPGHRPVHAWFKNAKKVDFFRSVLLHKTPIFLSILVCGTTFAHGKLSHHVGLFCLWDKTCLPMDKMDNNTEIKQNKTVLKSLFLRLFPCDVCSSKV